MGSFAELIRIRYMHASGGFYHPKHQSLWFSLPEHGSFIEQDETCFGSFLESGIDLKLC